MYVNNDEAFGNDVGESEDDFVRIMSKDWHDDFSFFLCVPPCVDENAGLHLTNVVTDHECTQIKVLMNLFLDMIRAANEV